ncbi:MAG: hypothetical protein ABIA77_03775 [Candidatus Omnitrophota bacterium]
MSKYFRTGVFGLAALSCLIIVNLTGCGKKEQGTAGVAGQGAKTAEMEGAEAPVPSSAPITEERTYYGFEGSLDGWEIPMWTEGQSDYVAKEVTNSGDVASEGASSIKVITNFPGGAWTAGLVEVEQYLDLSGYRVISADLYLPENAPEGLRVKLILTVGEDWKFVEMSRSVFLEPGKWVTITANIEPGSYDWKRVIPDAEFAQDVRKIAIRIESNRKPAYSGPVYIDNVRVGK